MFFRACADAEHRAAEDAAWRNAAQDWSFIDEKGPAGKDVRRRAIQNERASDWVLNESVTEIEMNERQFWNFVAFQPFSEKPWVTFMGRPLRVSDMPEGAQRRLGIHDPQRPGAI